MRLSCRGMTAPLLFPSFLLCLAFVYKYDTMDFLYKGVQSPSHRSIISKSCVDRPSRALSAMANTTAHRQQAMPSVDTRTNATTGTEDKATSYPMNSRSEHRFGNILKEVYEHFKRKTTVPGIAKYMYDQYLEIRSREICDWKCLIQKGFSVHYADFAMLQWMLLSDTTHVALFWPAAASDEATMKIYRATVSHKCGHIVYEKTIALNRQGLDSLAFHVYGGQPLLELFVKKFGHRKTKMNVVAMFFVSDRPYYLDTCLTNLHEQYAMTKPTPPVHIPSDHDSAILISEMILNPNSVMFLNHHKGQDCRHVANEIGIRLKLPDIKNGCYVLPQSIMVDSGAVMSFFGIRKMADVELLFQDQVIFSILGNRSHSDLRITSHTSDSNQNGTERPWEIEHLDIIESHSVEDLFLDPANHGYCHGIKFVSLQQLIRYQTKRGELNEDSKDVEMIQAFLKREQIT